MHLIYQIFIRKNALSLVGMTLVVLTTISEPPLAVTLNNKTSKTS